MTARLCVQKRVNGYYFRKKIPIELRRFLSKHEIVKSLKTYNKHQAIRSALQLNIYIEDCFDRIKHGEAISLSQIEDVIVTNSGNVVQQTKGNSFVTLQDILTKWSIATKPSLSTIAEWQLCVRQFTELFGSIDLTKITTTHIIKYKDTISNLPARYNVKHQGLTIQQISRLYTDEPSGCLPSSATITKRIAALKSLLSFAKSEGLISSNPTEGIKVKGGKKRQLIRKCFTDEDLAKMFGSLQGYNNHNFWIPYLALYTGARLEELGQLRIADVIKQGNVYFLDINSEGDKKLKTNSSIRKIPIHAKLLEAGLMQYVDSIRQNSLMMFPELTCANGKRTKQFTKWFARHLDRIGITDKAKVFHSFRHTFKDACRNAEIPEDIHDALTGHSNLSVSRRYGEGHKLETLNRYLQRIEYKGLETTK